MQHDTVELKHQRELTCARRQAEQHTLLLAVITFAVRSSELDKHNKTINSVMPNYSTQARNNGSEQNANY